MFDIASIIF